MENRFNIGDLVAIKLKRKYNVYKVMDIGEDIAFVTYHAGTRRRNRVSGKSYFCKLVMGAEGKKARWTRGRHIPEDWLAATPEYMIPLEELISKKEVEILVYKETMLKNGNKC